MRSNFFIIILWCVLCNTVSSQDFHFSQFNENPLLLNPALAGANQVMRVSIVYRDQWRSITTPFKSYGISFESRFKTSNWTQVDSRRSMTFKKTKGRMAGGITVYNDKAGNSKMGTLSTNLTYAMFFPLNKNSRLSLGLQGGFVQRKLDESQLIYNTQYNGYTYDPNLASGETYSRNSFMYGDLGSGLAYTFSREERSIAANDQINANIGFGVFHLTRPNQKFTSGKVDRLYRKYVFHGNLIFGIRNTSLGIAPGWLVQIQGGAKEITAGIMLKYNIKDNSKYTGNIKRSSVGIGAYYRTGDAIITNLSIETGRFALGFSYDINTSKLVNVSNAKGGFEVTLRMITPAAFLYQRRGKSMF